MVINKRGQTIQVGDKLKAAYCKEPSVTVVAISPRVITLRWIVDVTKIQQPIKLDQEYSIDMDVFLQGGWTKC